MALLIRSPLKSSSMSQPSGPRWRCWSGLPSLLFFPTKRAEMALLVGVSVLLVSLNFFPNNRASRRCWSGAPLNQAGQVALLVRSPLMSSGFVGQESSDVFLVVPTKRAAMALLVGTSVFKILTNRESRSGTVGRVLLGPQCFLNQASRGGTVGQDFVLLFCFSDFLPNQTSSGPCDLRDSVGRESAESFIRSLAKKKSHHFFELL